MQPKGVVLGFVSTETISLKVRHPRLLGLGSVILDEEGDFTIEGPQVTVTT
jgi:hypothetical protein